MKGELITKEFEWYVEYYFEGDTYHIPLHPDQPKLFEANGELKVGGSVLFDALYDNPSPYGLAVITEFISPTAPPPSPVVDTEDIVKSDTFSSTVTVEPKGYTSVSYPSSSWDDIYEAATEDNRTTMFGFLRYLKEHYNPPSKL